MEEPTVLDYVKSLLKDWRQLLTLFKEVASPKAEEGVTTVRKAAFSAEALTGATPEEESRQLVRDPGKAVSTTPLIPQQDPTVDAAFATVSTEQALPQRLSRAERLAILSGLSALTLALFAQISLEPPRPDATLGAVLYGITALILLFASLRAGLEVPLSPHPQPLSPWERGESPHPQILSQGEKEFRLHLPAFGAGLVSAALAFLTFGSGDFNTLNLFLWSLSFALIVRAFYPYHLFRLEWIKKVFEWLQKQEWQVRITRWSVLVFLAAMVLLFFRFYRLADVPPEMVSDHAEKLLDVADVLDGKWHIFYPRNTGREAFQMFLTAAVAKFFGTGLSFMSLKLGTAIAGLLTLIYIYLLGKEIANRRVGLFAVMLAGVSYWLNVITRVGLRFSLYPLFVAPTLYYLIRALRRPNPKDFILCGFFLGLGLHGYSPFRLVPLVVLAAIGLALLHRSTPQSRRALIIGLVIVAIISLTVFLPLLRYALQNPEIFFYRGLTRLTDIEKPLDRPALEIFFSNLWRALIMFFWDNGNVWVVSIPGRPALSVVPAALLFIGGFLVLMRYLHRREWLDLFLLV
ncbi:MAG: glycosyltransferase family 39 protein, partial [Anaerolineales bacterium]|nr:glycosyltransferase family 39 protein [Anaerolineales bacterium]MDW8447973.1 glycosyltransferase family 39 protein [Anaerolineales bacterium]